MSFSSISTRGNGQKIVYDWFNALRTAGIALETLLGAGYIGEVSATIANDQRTPSNVTSASFDPTLYKSFLLFCEIRRKTATNEAIAQGFLHCFYRDLTTAWDHVALLSGDIHGLVFNFSSNQLQYTSSSISGSSYVGTLKYKAFSFSI